MPEVLWWHHPLRVVQYNLQVQDTPKMNPKKIAQDVSDLSANTLVINAGGIYAWYSSKIPYHHINEYLPQDFDLLGEIIKECHALDIRVVARFDFSKTDDFVYQQKPQWFVREPDLSPRIYGAERPGNWSLLYTTCLNAGYRNEEVAIPVLQEVIDRYPIDGIFFNAPNYEYCYCEACRRKYKKLYGKPLPTADNIAEYNSTYPHRTLPADLEPDFPGRCVRDNMEKIYGAVKAKAPDLPLILYYGLRNENLDDRYATADMICTESQNVLSRGWRDIPPIGHPTIAMKLGSTVPGRPQPFGIIHSCPGMDWRHTGMPPAEYRFWMSQVTAAGGQIWHSLTGFNDTIRDKRILDAVRQIDVLSEKAQREMENAAPRSDLLLLWNSQKAAEDWAELLIENQLQFDILDHYQLTPERLSVYSGVILPNHYPLTEQHIRMLTGYVQNGGRLLLEGNTAEQLAPFAGIAGFTEEMSTGEYLTAAYGQFEPAGKELQEKDGLPPLFPYRGKTAYLSPEKGTSVLATLVPPFAPLHAVGAPPERASMLVDHTEIPLILLRDAGKGKVLTLPFPMSELAGDYRLGEHRTLARGLIETLLGDALSFKSVPVNGLQMAVYQREDALLVHLLNGIGQRPLMDTIPYHDASFSIRIPDGKKVKTVQMVLTESSVSYTQNGEWLHVTINRLDVWDMAVIALER